LTGNFLFLGWRTGVAELLGACDALLLTSIFEGLPRVVLQAFAAGKPVVATAVSGTPEAVTQGVNGFLCAPHDATDLARCLALLLKDPRRARRMGAAGRKVLKGSFLMPRMLSEIEDLYMEVLRSKKVVII
jgi:glycosyltransferase involved in cell wall biosynthesis